MNFAFMPLFWVLVTLPILLILQRWIHLHLQGLSLLIMGTQERAVILYAIILLPGVFLHEVSHWLSATLLGVRTGSLSVIPQQQNDGTVRLGYMEYDSRSLDPVRESIIGGAPLITGTAVILLIGFKVFNITELGALLQTGQIVSIAQMFKLFLQTPDIFLWLYLLFTIANGMMPSRSDRRAWPAFAAFLGLVFVIAYFLGILDVVTSELTQPVLLIFGYLGLAFSLAIGVDIISILVISLFEAVLGHIKGVSVAYKSHENSN